MQIYPAIDLREGKCVRLHQGDFNQAICYSEDPHAIAQTFINEGATWLHVIDLDGAKDPNKNQADLIGSLIKQTQLKVQTGGGIRTAMQIQNLLAQGAARVIIGSLAVREPALIKSWLQQFGKEKLVIAMDVQQQGNDFFIATSGWQELSSTKLVDLLNFYGTNLQHLLCTDISKDGTLKGPNINLYRELREKFPAIELQASGGIGDLADIQALRQIPVAGAVVGKALYENKFKLSETC